MLHSFGFNHFMLPIVENSIKNYNKDIIERGYSPFEYSVEGSKISIEIEPRFSSDEYFGTMFPMEGLVHDKYGNSITGEERDEHLKHTVCDCCHSNRYRRQMHIYKKDDKFLYFGDDCLESINGDSLLKALKRHSDDFARMMRKAEEENDIGFFEGTEFVKDFSGFFDSVVEILENDVYVSRALSTIFNEETTGIKAWNNDAKSSHPELFEQFKEWLSTKDCETDDLFRVASWCVEANSIIKHAAGTASYVISRFLIGEYSDKTYDAGERIEVRGKIADISTYSKEVYHYGDSNFGYKITMRTDEGAKLVWFTTKYPGSFPFGKYAIIKAISKGPKEYRGEISTTVKNVKFLEIQE